MHITKLHKKKVKTNLQRFNTWKKWFNVHQGTDLGRNRRFNDIQSVDPNQC